MSGWRAVFSEIMRVAIARLPLPEPRVIYDREGGSAYLSRYYLVGEKPRTSGKGQTVPADDMKASPFGVFLHRFHRSDQGQELHNHPWEWAFSIVLAGGYSEERRVGHRVVRRSVPPGSLNFLGQDDFHRVDLLEDDAWTLFVVGPKVNSWSFWNRLTGELVSWREHITRLRGEGWQES